jgi:thiamine pyrophosphokinase
MAKQRQAYSGRAFLVGPVVPDKHAREFIGAQLRALKLKRPKYPDGTGRSQSVGLNPAEGQSTAAGKNDLLIAIDGGLKTCKDVGLIPDLVVGDWDSLPNHPALVRLRDQLPHLTLPENKDRSDLWFAVNEAKNLQVQELHCFGMSGGRPDHHQAMVLDLTEASSEFESIHVHGPEASYIFLAAPRGHRVRLRLKAGQVVSVFGEASGVKFKGLKFPLRGGILRSSRAGSLGLSNQVLGKSSAALKPCSIELKKGRLLIVIPHENVENCK